LDSKRLKYALRNLIPIVLRGSILFKAMSGSILRDKSYAFAVQIVRLVQILQSAKNEFVLSNQILRSGTSIGANVREAQFGQSPRDFINKMSIALKEANESLYWLNLLRDTAFIDHKTSQEYIATCDELISMLVATIKTMKLKLKSPS
jgi:four helix bundle protein